MDMEVRDPQGKVLGKIADVLTLPANNVYVVRGGERELMIPAVPSSSPRPIRRAVTFGSISLRDCKYET